MNTLVLFALVATCVAAASASFPGAYGGYGRGYAPYVNKEAVEAAIAKRKELVEERKAAVEALREAQAGVYEAAVDLRKTYNPYGYGAGLGLGLGGYGAGLGLGVGGFGGYGGYGYRAAAAEE